MFHCIFQNFPFYWIIIICLRSYDIKYSYLIQIIYTFKYVLFKVSCKVGNHSRGRPEGSLFNSYYTEVYGEGATPFPGLLYCTLDSYLIMLSASKAASSTIFWVFGMTRPGIEPQFPGPLTNTLIIWPMVKYSYLNLIIIWFQVIILI